MADTTMREYIDVAHGAGTWDKMHDAIKNFNLFGWDMPVIEVDGINCHIFPGTNREVTLAEVKAEVRKVLEAMKAGRVPDIPEDNDLWVSYIDPPLQVNPKEESLQ